MDQKFSKLLMELITGDIPDRPQEASRLNSRELSPLSDALEFKLSFDFPFFLLFFSDFFLSDFFLLFFNFKVRGGGLSDIGETDLEALSLVSISRSPSRVSAQFERNIQKIFLSKMLVKSAHLNHYLT